MRELDGKTVLITGASRGIGAATARRFALDGANVVLAARSGEAITALAEEIGAQARAVVCDVAQWGDVLAVVEFAVETFGSLDVLINNAGTIHPIGHLDTADPEAWSQAIDINLKGVFYGFRAAIPVMRARGGGTILTVSSGAAHYPVEGWGAYCVSKAGALMLHDVVGHELPEAGLRIMGLSPGTVRTEMQVDIKASGINPVSQLDPSVHIPAEWPAEALRWMCTPDADEFVGTEISLRDDAILRRIGLTQ